MVSPTTNERGRAIHVLVVDDEPCLVDISQHFLELNHFSTEAACSADEAMEKVRTGSFDIIVSDYQMPKKDGIALLKEVRLHDPLMPFILFTGRSREEVVIQALNEGADFYIQKGGEPQAQFAELAHKIQRAVERRNAATAITERNEVLGAILAASPFGIALVKNRTIQWANEGLAQMVGYPVSELIGMPVRQLYATDEAYSHAGEIIFSDLRATGESSLQTQLVRKDGTQMDGEVHMATLNTKNPLFSRMVTIADVTKRLAITRGIEHLSRMPHLELNPVIEVTEKGQIAYFNEAAIDFLIRQGNGVQLESFLPQDIKTILSAIPPSGTRVEDRAIRVGSVPMMAHITLSGRYRVARISAFDAREAKQMDCRADDAP